MQMYERARESGPFLFYSQFLSEMAGTQQEHLPNSTFNGQWSGSEPATRILGFDTGTGSAHRSRYGNASMMSDSDSRLSDHSKLDGWTAVLYGREFPTRSVVEGTGGTSSGAPRTAWMARYCELLGDTIATNERYMRGHPAHG